VNGFIVLSSPVGFYEITKPKLTLMFFLATISWKDRDWLDRLVRVAASPLLRRSSLPETDEGEEEGKRNHRRNKFWGNRHQRWWTKLKLKKLSYCDKLFF
jgi:hypothetical protein